MSVSDMAFDRYLDDAFDRAEQYERELEGLAILADLAYATACLCDHFVASLRRAQTAMLGGQVLDLAMAKQMMDEHCDDAIREFIRAWRAAAPDIPDRLSV